MATFRKSPPLWYWLVAGLLTLWDAVGCYMCYLQSTKGADWMPDATDYDRQLLASMPGWYNWCYAIAVGAGLLGGIALLARRRLAKPLFVVSLIAVIIQFAYVLLATDLIAVKGFATAAGFPIFITVLAVFAVWFAHRADKRGWIV